MQLLTVVNFGRRCSGANKKCSQMPLVSVQISLGARVLRPWGIINPSSGATLWDVFTALKDGSLGNFTLPLELVDQPVRCSVGATLCGVFQECPLNLLIQEVSQCFGKQIAS